MVMMDDEMMVITLYGREGIHIGRGEKERKGKERKR